MFGLLFVCPNFSHISVCLFACLFLLFPFGLFLTLSLFFQFFCCAGNTYARLDKAGSKTQCKACKTQNTTRSCSTFTLSALLHLSSVFFCLLSSSSSPLWDLEGVELVSVCSLPQHVQDTQAGYPRLVIMYSFIRPIGAAVRFFLTTTCAEVVPHVRLPS